MSARLEFTGAKEGPHAWRLNVHLPDEGALIISMREVISGRFEVIIKGAVASITYEVGGDE